MTQFNARKCPTEAPKFADLADLKGKQAAPRPIVTARLKTITPMFGGSASAGQVDLVNPVRAASVRGHLRFWWRATAGARCSSLAELYKKESELWGNTEQQGKIRAEVEICSAGREESPQKPAYALFPFRDSGAKGCESVEFRLKLTYTPHASGNPASADQIAEIRAELETALAAWVMFGGIGARTRRGCGSLDLVAGADGADGTDDIQALTLSLAVNGSAKKPDQLLTILPCRYFVGRSFKNASAAWCEAVEIYQTFRQGVNVGRNEGQSRNRPGRSRYPEADTLRRWSGQHSLRHEPRHPVDGYPRADLGLPIIFHFQGNELVDHTLQGRTTGRQRFASPVITKAIRYGSEYRPLIVMLDSPHVWENPDQIEIKGKKTKEVTREEIELTPEERQKIRPLGDQGGQPIREAFLSFIQREGFEERTSDLTLNVAQKKAQKGGRS